MTTAYRTPVIGILAVALAEAGLALTLAVSVPAAHAEPVDTVNLTDIADIDRLPICAQEDCSDQPGQIGVWLDRDTGDWYLERGEDYTRRIIDNTAVAPHAGAGVLPGPK